MSDVKVVFSAEGASAVVSNAEQVKRSLTDVGNSQTNLADGAEGMGGRMGKAFELLSLDAVMDIGGKVVGALVDATEAIIEFSQEGAQLLRVEESGKSLARSMGVSMDSVMMSLRSASLGMVSDADLMLSANKALMLGVTDDAEKMGQIMEVAAIRGRAMGVETSKAFKDIIEGIGRASPQILDNLGIITDAENTYANYAASIGKSANELSKAEKSQALLNRVLADTAPLLAANGLAMDTAGKWEAMTAAQTNYFDRLKKQLAESTSGWADYWAANFNTANAATEYQDLEAELKRLGLWTQAMTDFRESTKTVTTSLGRGQTIEGFFWSGEADIAFVEKFMPELVKYQEGIITTTEVQNDWYDSNYEGVNSLEMIAQAQENSTKKQQEALAELRLEYEETADALADASLDLDIAVRTFHESVGDQLVKGLRDAGLEGEALEERLGILDELMGTSYVMEYKLELATDDLLETLINDPDAFAAKFKAFDSVFTPLNKAVAAAMTEVGNLESQLDSLNGKIIEVEIRMNITNGSGSTINTGDASNLGFDPLSPFPKALGGPVYENTPYLVGERGPELFVPNTQGQIIPDYILSNNQTNASFDIDYQRLGRVISESIIEAAEEGRIGNNYMINENGRREMMNNNFELLRAYGSNR